jgi:ribosomal protein L11 methyltransferase
MVQTMAHRSKGTPSPTNSARAERPDASVRLHRWTRLSSKNWEDAWVERLRFLGPSKVVFVTWPNSNVLKIEAYCQQRQARELISRFGGRVTKVPEHIWTGDPARPRAPLSIRGRLKVFSDQHQWRQWKQSHSNVAGIFIPAGMAFGTGEHATTATCLRLLADIARDVPASFTVLDLGTGAGILAIAAKALGAGRVAAVDFDRVAVRIARQNAFTNGFSMIKISHADVLELGVRKVFDIVLANLFSDVLIQAASRIARVTRPGGWLVFSGVLRNQVRPVAEAFMGAGFANPRIIFHGKWCAGVCQKSPSILVHRCAASGRGHPSRKIIKKCRPITNRRS